ncbi:MAG: exodeoxyribonuclease VII large subunit [Planctomycetota bacterium]
MGDSEPVAVYTVSELQREIRALLEGDYAGIWVEGEISGARRPPSGHCYLTLKDADAQLSAVCWRSTVQRLRFEPEDGLAVRARGHLTVYEPSGRYQMIVQALEPLGAGPLQVRFEQMRKRLEKEGLFDPDHKRELPGFPRRAALVTSPSGAAVRDLVHVCKRRWPLLELIVVPVKVQGEGAAEEIAGGVAIADRLGCDLMVVGRGGGSLEDLWAFNEEAVARAVFSASTPVVSAVGHEIDVSICDLVADVRAATPSAAAERITPDATELLELVAERRSRLARALESQVRELRTRLKSIEAARAFRRPLAPVRSGEQALDDLAQRLAAALSANRRERHRRLELLVGRMEALSPLKVLARGYSVTMKDKMILRRATEVRSGDLLRTTLAEGEIRSVVE